MKVLFLNLPYKFDISRASRWPEKTKSGTMYYPYWLCYAAGVCLNQGYEVNLVDCIAKKLKPKDVIDLISEEQPDYIVGEITTSTVEYDYKMLTMIKKHFPQIHLLVGGTHATVLSEQVMNECSAIDVVMRHYRRCHKSL